jgi:hypothetical protein
MTEPGRDQLSGAQELLARGPEDHREVVHIVDPLTTADLLAGTSGDPAGRSIMVRAVDIEVVVAPEWLADLHDPTLVISHGYVGPDRRRSDRGAPRDAEPTDRTLLDRLLRRIGQIVCMTLVVAVPLTLIASRSVPPATNGAPTPATAASPRSAGRVGHHATHVFTASAQQVAKADAAYQRALAREQDELVTGAPDSGGGATVATGSAGVPADVSLQSAQASAAAAAATVAAQAQAAAARAAAQAAAAQRRAQAQAARAAAQAAKRAGGGEHAGGGSANGTSNGTGSGTSTSTTTSTSTSTTSPDLSGS